MITIKDKFSQNAFTLIEIMLVTGLLMVVAAAVFAVASLGQISWRESIFSIRIQDEARRAMDQMVKELTQTRVSLSELNSSVPADDIFYPSVSFRIPYDVDADGDVLSTSNAIEWSEVITYSLSGDQLIRSVSDGSSGVVANYISNLQFRRLSTAANRIEINITATRTSGIRAPSSFSLNSQVKLRN